jgi:hypothetical protein
VTPDWVCWDSRHERCNQSIGSRGRIRLLRDGWASVTFWFRSEKRVEVRREQLNVGGAMASGFTAALENDRAAGCDPFIDFIRRKDQEFVYQGVNRSLSEARTSGSNLYIESRSPSSCTSRAMRWVFLSVPCCLPFRMVHRVWQSTSMGWRSF